MTAKQSSIFILFGIFNDEREAALGAYTSRDGAMLALVDYKSECGKHGYYDDYYIQDLVINVPVGNI